MLPSRRAYLHTFFLSFFVLFAALPACAGAGDKAAKARSAQSEARKPGKINKHAKKRSKIRKKKPVLGKRGAKKHKKISKAKHRKLQDKRLVSSHRARHS